MLGIPFKEYACMPISELVDLISAYKIIHGFEEEKQMVYIPDLR